MRFCDVPPPRRVVPSGGGGRLPSVAARDVVGRGPPEGGADGTKRSDGTGPLPRIPPPPPSKIAARRPPPPPPSTAEVTPSPTFGTVSLEEHASPLVNTCRVESAETPLPASPNPTRHTMGAEKSTPDSAIRPMALSYDRREAEGKGAARPSEDAEGGPRSADATRPTRKEEGAPTPKGAGGGPDRTPEVRTPEIERAGPIAPKKAQETPSKAGAPVVIQNGTLAAASALMTLFGNEKSPQQA